MGRFGWVRCVVGNRGEQTPSRGGGQLGRVARKSSLLHVQRYRRVADVDSNWAMAHLSVSMMLVGRKRAIRHQIALPFKESRAPASYVNQVN